MRLPKTSIAACIIHVVSAVISNTVKDSNNNNNNNNTSTTSTSTIVLDVDNESPNNNTAAIMSPSSSSSSSSSSLTQPIAARNNKSDTTEDDENEHNNNSDSNNINLYILKKQLKLLLIVRCLRSAHLAQPLLVPYYINSLYIKPTSVLWLGSFYSALVTIAELPSGLLSDYLGRKTTLHIAFLGFSCSLLLTAFASTRMMVLTTGSSSSSIHSNSNQLWIILGIAQFLRAIGSSMYSGTDMAFLYEIIKKYGSGSSGSSGSSGDDSNSNSSDSKKKKKKKKEKDKYNDNKGSSDNKDEVVVVAADTLLLKIESRNVFYTTLTEAIIAAIGGWIAKRVGLPKVVALASIPFLLGAIISLFLIDSSSSSSTDSSSSSDNSSSDKSSNDVKSDHNNEQQKQQQQQQQNNNNNNAPLPRILPRKTSLLTFPSIAPQQQQQQQQQHQPNNDCKDNINDRSSFFSQTTKQDKTTNNSKISSFISSSIKRIQLYVPQKLWTLFTIGVVLNCGTYVASTSLNPILWEYIGIPISQFGTVHACCGSISAISALFAPTVRAYISKLRSSSSSSKNKNRSDTEGILLFMLCTSALGYGLMTISTILRFQFFSSTLSSSSSSSQTTTTTTTTMTSSIIFAIVASFLLSLVRGLAWPVLGSAINTSVTNNNSRATTLSMFSGAIKIGMVLTGMVLGVLFNKSSSSSGGGGDIANNGDGNSNNIAIGKGLLQGCSLCGIVLISTAIWLAGIGLTSTSESADASSITHSTPSHQGLVVEKEKLKDE